jgi:hypothetical protein
MHYLLNLERFKIFALEFTPLSLLHFSVRSDDISDVLEIVINKGSPPPPHPLVRSNIRSAITAKNFSGLIDFASTS